MELDRLPDIPVVNFTFNTMAKVRRAKIKLVICCSAPELYGQFHLAWTSCSDLQQNYAEGEAVGGGGRLEELDVDVGLFVLLNPILFLRESFNLQQVRRHIWRPMVDLIRNADLVRVFDLGKLAEV